MVPSTLLCKSVFQRPKSLKPQALLKMHLIYHPAQVTMAGLSARLSVGPLSPAGEEKGRWPHLSAPALTWAESRMWTIQVFSSRESQLRRPREAGCTLLFGVVLLCLGCFSWQNGKSMLDDRRRASDGCLGSGQQGYSKGACFSCSVRPWAIGARGGVRETLRLCQVCGSGRSFLLHPQIAVFSH